MYFVENPKNCGLTDGPKMYVKISQTQKMHISLVNMKTILKTSVTEKNYTKLKLVYKLFMSNTTEKDMRLQIKFTFKILFCGQNAKQSWVR